jgi:hypothetical protein
VAYWVDGMIRCGLLLGDEALVAKARVSIDAVMDRPDRDGYLGPDAMKTLDGPYGSERWPHAVFFRAVLADLEARPSKQRARRLVRHYLSGTAEHVTSRNICNVEIMAALVELTGDERMRDLAVSSYAAYQRLERKHGSTVATMLSDRAATDHGPRYMELFKLGAIVHRLTGKARLLKASRHAYAKLKRDHILIDGVPSATEHLRGIYGNAGHETCVVTDLLWSLRHLLAASGDATLGDDMERIAFNALPGCVTPDFRALQYFSGPNQVVAGSQTNHHPHGTGSSHTSYRPNPATECCPGNVHRAMPAFAGSQWMVDAGGTLFAALYGPSRCTVGRGAQRLTVRQETTYPFSDTVRFRVEGRSSATRLFAVRIPGWCKKPRLRVNGKAVRITARAGCFFRLPEPVRGGDIVELQLPFSVRVERGPDDSRGVVWGPLVLTLPVGERWERVADPRSNEDFPAWTLMPQGAWNYGISREVLRTLRKARPELRPLTGNPWETGHAPVVLAVPVKKIPGWKLERARRLTLGHGARKRVVEGPFVFTPSLPSKAVREGAARRDTLVGLVPLGAARLRVTWLPVLTS